MTEFDILYLLHEKMAVYWGVFQFWSGVTFAYVAVSHFAASRLHGFIVLCLTIIYAAMFFHVLQLIGENDLAIDGLILDLEEYSARVQQVSNATKARLASAESLSTIPAIVAIFGSFLGSLVYLPYKKYWASREHT